MRSKYAFINFLAFHWNANGVFAQKQHAASNHCFWVLSIFEDVEDLGLLGYESKEEEVSPEEDADMGAGAFAYNEWKEAFE